MSLLVLLKASTCSKINGMVHFILDLEVQKVSPLRIFMNCHVVKDILC